MWGVIMLKLICVSCAALLLGCANTTPEPVSTTTTSSADERMDLYLSRSPRTACPADLPSTILFAPHSAALSSSADDALDAWATCLRQDKLQHATVVLVGSEEVGNDSEIFEARAEQVRQTLAARGIDARRVVIAAPNGQREGGRGATSEGVRLEVTGIESVRNFEPSPLRARRRALR